MQNTKPGRIILVDDMSFFPDLIREELISKGISNISVFSDPSEALKSVLSDSDEPCFVLTDFNMPTMTGTELLHEIKKKYCKIHAAILTADPRAVNDSEFPIIDKGGQFTTTVLEIMANVV